LDSGSPEQAAPNAEAPAAAEDCRNFRREVMVIIGEQRNDLQLSRGGTLRPLTAKAADRGRLQATPIVRCRPRAVTLAAISQTLAAHRENGSRIQ
jgi:hypothetical protein